MIQHFVIEQSASLVLFLSHDVLLSSVQSLSYAERSLVYWFTACFVLPDIFGPSFLVTAIEGSRHVTIDTITEHSKQDGSKACRVVAVFGPDIHCFR